MALSEECVALSRKLGDGVAFALYALGMAELNRNELGRAWALLERASGDAADVARVLAVLGLVAVVRHADYMRQAPCPSAPSKVTPSPEALRLRRSRLP